MPPTPSFPELIEPISLLMAFGLPGTTEWIVILIIGLLIFGRRLPEVGRSIGRSIVEFKKGIKGIEDEIEQESSKNVAPATPTGRLSDRSATDSPRVLRDDEAESNPYAATRERDAGG